MARRHVNTRRSLFLFLAFAAIIHGGRATAENAAEVDQSPLTVKTERAFPELGFERPTVLTHAGDGSNRLFIVSQLGKVFVIPNDQDVKAADTFLDIKARVAYKDNENEEGLLGLAFHPKFKMNGQFVVYYTSKQNPHTSIISRFRVSSDNPGQADPASEEKLLTIKQPYWNHNGGNLAFGPDGYLYIGLGDGGAREDPHGHGQNLETLLGSLLRIDVDRKADGKNYSVPPDNPFRGKSNARPEIWAYGFRNIWGLSFDRETGQLWVADVGQDIWEEIDIVRRGGNYGWKLREAKHKFGAKGSGPREDLIDPIWEYNHEVGKSITGGVVYRGKRVPEVQGSYLYADYVSGKLWALRYDSKKQRVVSNRPLIDRTSPIIAFGEDEAGEAYLTDVGGNIWRLQSTGM